MKQLAVLNVFSLFPPPTQASRSRRHCGWVSDKLIFCSLVFHKYSHCILAVIYFALCTIEHISIYRHMEGGPHFSGDTGEKDDEEEEEEKEKEEDLLYKLMVGICC